MPNFPSLLMSDRGDLLQKTGEHQKLHDSFLADYERQNGGRTYMILAHRNGVIWQFITQSQGIFLMLGVMSDDTRVALGRWLEHCVYGGGANGYNHKIQLKPDSFEHPSFNMKQQVISVIRVDEGEHSNWKDTFTITFALSPAN